MNLTFHGVSHDPIVVGFITLLLSPPFERVSLVGAANYHYPPIPSVLA
jgi:hypothetical protein